MAESMKGLKRTHRCTEISTANIGENVTLMGWVQKSRNKGGIIFVDLRVFSMAPVRENVFVPGLPSVPMVRNQSAPSRMIFGTLAYVSTLFSTVGFSHRPFSTVRGGFTRGIPLFPSMDAVRADPSPHTKAPAPRLICRWKFTSEPRI